MVFSNLGYPGYIHYKGNLQMKHMITVGAAAIIAAALATPAAAIDVLPGTYTFTAADGTQQMYTVSYDSNSALAVTGLSVNFIEPCNVTGTETPYTLETGWGFGGDYVIPTNGKVTINAAYNYFVFDITLHFGADGNASSTLSEITSYGLTLYPVFSDKPKKALFCESALQTAQQTMFTPPAGADEPSVMKGVKFTVESDK
jgi:hypothetical protein